MGNIAKIAQWLVRITGLIQIVLGLLIWLGASANLILVHMFSGLIFVISLWVLGLAGLRARSAPGLAVFTLLYGVLVLGLGFYQPGLLPGPAHWIIRVVHLLVGLGAMGLAQAVSSRSLTQVRA